MKPPATNKQGEVATLEPDELPGRIIPTDAMDDEDVETADIDYSIRAPEDWVVGGPLGPHGYGRGRHFGSWDEVAAWAKDFYGARYKELKGTEEERNGQARWAVLVKGPRGVVN
jgi:hypothetical protein